MNQQDYKITIVFTNTTKFSREAMFTGACEIGFILCTNATIQTWPVFAGT